MTDISFWPHAHVLSSSHEQFPPQQKGGIPFTFICGVVPTKQHGLVKWHLPFIQGFQEVIKVKEFVRIFFCETGSSAGTCGKPVSHYSLVLSLSQWSMQSTFLVLGGYQFSPISLEKKQKQKKKIQYVHKQYDFVTYSNIKYQVKKRSLHFFNGEQLNLKPLRAIQYLHCSTRLHWQDKLVL